MKGLLLTFIVTLLLAFTLSAQVPKGTDKREIAVYGNCIRGDVTYADLKNTKASFDKTRDSCGVMVESSEFLNDGPLGVGVSFSSNRSSAMKIDTVLFKATLKANRKGKIEPFASAGIGVSHQNNWTRKETNFFLQNFGNGGAASLGAGVEFKLSRRFGVATQAELLVSDIGHPATTPTRYNARVSVGGIWHF